MNNKSYQVSIDRYGNKTIFVNNDYPVEKSLFIRIPDSFEYEDAVLTNELTKALVHIPTRDQSIQLEKGFVLDSRIPVITLFPDRIKNKLPVIFLLHGFETSKEKVIKFGLRFALKGFFTVMMDAPMHGQRLDVDLFHKLYDLSGDVREVWKNRLEMMQLYLSDVKSLMDYYGRDSRLDFDRLGISGISMGGTVSMIAAANDPRIRSVAAFIPVLDYENLPEFAHVKKQIQDDLKEARKFDPVYLFQKAPSASVFVLSGSEDRVVGIKGSRKLNQKLSALYENNPDHYQYNEYQHVGHTVTLVMAEDAAEWFGSTLKNSEMKQIA